MQRLSNSLKTREGDECRGFLRLNLRNSNLLLLLQAAASKAQDFPTSKPFTKNPKTDAWEGVEGKEIKMEYKAAAKLNGRCTNSQLSIGEMMKLPTKR